MKIVLIRLLVVILLVVGIGVIIVKFVDLPGNFSSLKTYFENQNEKVSAVVLEKANTICAYENFDIVEFCAKKDAYSETIIKLKNIFECGKTKNFTWQNEKKLKSSMDKVFKEENYLKDDITSLTNYVNQDNSDTETIQSMINNETAKLQNITTEYDNLRKEVASYLIEENED